MFTVSFLIPLTVQSKSLSPSERQALESQQGTHWYGVYVFGRKAGYAKMSFEIGEQSYEVGEEVQLSIQAMGNAQEIYMSAQRSYSKKTGAIQKISSAFKQSGQNIRAELEVTKGIALLTQWVSGEKTENQVDLPLENIHDALALSLKQKSGELKGDLETHAFEALPPLSRELLMRHKVLKQEKRMVDGVELNLTTIETTVPDQGISTRTLMRDDGVVLETEMMGMMKLRLEPENIAKSKGETPDVLALSLAIPNEAIERPREVQELELRLDLPKIPDTFSGDHVEIPQQTPQFIEIRTQAPPLKHRSGTSIAPREALEPTTLIQSKAPGIIAKAKEITKGARNRRERIERLVTHVSTGLKKEYRAALSNAVDVLKEPAGDCTEHAVYFVALARAAGIPSRVVVGLTYTSMGEGGFGGHAWAEVHYRGGWHQVDPTFGQVSADATHIPLAIGNISDITHVGSIIGQVRVRVLKVRHKTP